MMTRIILLNIYVILSVGILFAQTDNVSLSKKSNYHSWGTNWDSEVVMTNSLCTLTVVPKIGGRTMQYNLGAHAPIYVASGEVGETPTTYTIMGGFFTNVSPQSSWNWPPPPLLTMGAYTPTIIRNTADTCSVLLQGPVETTSSYPNVDGLQFKRTVTMFAASTRINIAMTLVNKGTTTPVPHGIWDITECTGGTQGIAYDTMIWVYFPLNPKSKLGDGRGYVCLNGFTDTTQWVKNAGGAGIMGIRYKGKAESLVGADDIAGWICYVDRRDGYTFVKRFTYVTGATYPDSGSSISVYTENNASFLEVEVKGPISTLAPGDSISMVEDWYAARSPGPIASVNNAGVVTRRLAAQPSGDSVDVHGSWGVFYPGYIKLVFVDASGSKLSMVDSSAVTPLDSFVLNKELDVPPNSSALYLADYAIGGTFIGNLDSVALSAAGIVGNGPALRLQKSDTRITLRPDGSLAIAAEINEPYSIEVSRLDGKRLAFFSGMHPQHFFYGRNGLSAGICLVTTRVAKCMTVQKIFVGK